MTTTTTAYSTTQVEHLAGVTYRQLDYWCRMGALVPELAEARGSGTQRRYSSRDVALAAVCGMLTAHGANLRVLGNVVAVLRDNDDAWLCSLLVTGDGDVTPTCTPDADLADLGLVACWVINPAAALARLQGRDS